MARTQSALDPQTHRLFQGTAVDGKAVVAVVGLLPFMLAPPQLASGIAHTGTHQRQRVAPQMAAGMTDHVWTTAELLGYRVPARFLDTLDAIQHLFPALDDAHHVN